MIFITRNKPKTKVYVMLAVAVSLPLTAMFLFGDKKDEAPKPVSLLSRYQTPASAPSSATSIASSAPSPQASIGKRSLVPDIKECDGLLVNSSIKLGADEVTKTLQTSRKQISARLISEGGEVERAAGVYILIHTQSHMNYQDCRTEQCVPAATESFRQETEGAIGQLVSIASTTKSSEVYSWALDACSGESVRHVAENSCATLSKYKGLALDPTNGWNWLSLAAEANGQGNTSGFEEALFMAANSKNWLPPSDRLAKIFLNRIPASADPLTTLGLLNDAKSISTKMVISGLNTFSSLCAAEADENRTQTCQKLTARILGSTTDLLGLSIGLKVGERVGASELLLATKREEYNNIKSLLPARPILKTSDPISGCRNSIPVINFLEDSVLNGEMSALRALPSFTSR